MVLFGVQFGRVLPSLTTATTTSFILINGAQEKNVYWALGTSAFIGYSSSFAGTILASKAIVFGHDSSIVGRALALTAVSFESGSSVTLPTSTPARYLRSEPETKVASIAITSVSVPLGACATFAVEAGSAMNFNGVKTYINEGSIGISPGTTIQGNYQVIDGSVEVTSTRSNQCQADRVTAYNAANAAPCSANNTRTELSGLTLGPGVYCSGGAMSLSAGTLTLDAFGDSSAVWITSTPRASTTIARTEAIRRSAARSSSGPRR